MAGADQEARLADIELLMDQTLATALAEVDAVAAVERGQGTDHPFWYVRMDGEAKDHFSAEFTLNQRTLLVESYFMPGPEENHEQLYAHLLTRNRDMFPLRFVIGAEDAIYLRGQAENRHIDAPLIDRMLASVFDFTERFFVPAMRIGYQSRFDR